jgi:hypothetical protein
MDEEGGCFLRLILFVAPFAIPSSFAWSFHIASLVIASLFVPSLVILTSGNPVKEGRVAVRNHLEALRPDRSPHPIGHAGGQRLAPAEPCRFGTRKGLGAVNVIQRVNISADRRTEA